MRLETLDAFHVLVQDEHVRRYLMDGEVFPRAWSEARVRESIALFSRRGVGLWLAREIDSIAVAGFCGFLDLPSVDPEPRSGTLPGAFGDTFTYRLTS